MDKLLPTLYSDYGKYVNEFRSFPYILDGAKMIERRLLYSLYETGKDRLVKSAKVVGHCIGHYHPHGDTSAYQSLVGLVQNDFAIGQGNWGNKAGVTSDPPAAMRYTECRFHKDILNLAFEYINDVPHELIEMEDPEPKFLPIKLPLCLLGNSYTEGIGFGYKTMIPSYTKSDLIKRLKWLLNDKKGKEPIIKPISDCAITSGKAELQTLLTTGKAKIEYQGRYVLDGKKSIIIEAIPYSTSFSKIFKKFNKEMTIDKSLGWQDDSTVSTRVRLTIVKPRMLKMANLEKKVKEALAGSVSFQSHICNTSGKVVLLGVDDMLLNVYKVYKQIVAQVLLRQSQEIQNSIDELNLIELIKPLLSVELKTNPDDLQLVIKNIASALSQKQEVIKQIFDKYTLSRIFRIKTDTQQLQQKKTIIDNNHKNIVDYIWKEKYLK
jgi:DNA gyrase/topoisomerase IV subunit A